MSSCCQMMQVSAGSYVAGVLDTLQQHSSLGQTAR